MKKIIISFAIVGCLAVSGVVAIAAQNTGKQNILSSKEISKKALSYVKGKVYKVELDYEKNGPVYDVDVKSEQAKYELKLDAKTGELLEKSTKYTSGYSSKDIIGLEKAKKIALKIVNGKIQKAKFNEEDGLYEFEILKGKYEYDIDINAYSGEVLKKEKEKITTLKNSKAISLKKAKQIALNYIDGVVQKVKYDRNRGIYEIHVAQNAKTFKFKIDAYTGQIINSGSNGSVNTESNYGIGVEKAKQIALNEVGGTIIDATFDSEDGVYEVKVQSGDVVYDIEINAVSGGIVKQEKEDSTTSLNNNGTVIGIEKAKQIALSKVSGTVTSSSYEQNDGVYEISILANGTAYDFDINAYTGEISKQDQKTVEDSSVSSSDATIITTQQASQIALTKAKGTVTKIELVIGVYDVEVKDGTYQYEIEIDAKTGDVLSVDKEYDD